jgi:ElaB/YqjD/DUF883 family membrane-anchored ribosome-binding protein
LIASDNSEIHEALMQPTSDDDRCAAVEGGTSSTGARNSAAGIGQRAAGKVDEKRATTAECLESTASALHAKADELPGGEFVRNAAHTAAEAMRSTASRIRETDVSGMIGGVQRLVRNNPGISLLIAASLGFVAGRALSRD